MDGFRRHFSEKVVSAKVASLISNSRRQSFYELSWKKWSGWCDRRGVEEDLEFNTIGAHIVKTLMMCLWTNIF